MLRSVGEKENASFRLPVVPRKRVREGACDEYLKRTSQRHASFEGQTADTPAIVHDVLHSSGQPLDSATRGMMESRFAHDFSSVRVHTDGRAAASAASIAANAYTLGNHVVFGQAPSPRLLAHELAHVVQQCAAPAVLPMTAAVGGAGTPLEREADRAADLVAAGRNAFVAGRGGAIQRDTASKCTYGEIREWAITSLTDFGAPVGLGDAKASIAAACARNPCQCIDGASNAKAPGDKASWSNIVAASGTDRSGGGEQMCVGTENCYFVHQCTTCGKGKSKRVEREDNLTAAGTTSVTGKGTLYFYTDPLKGWCNAKEFKSGCKAKPKPKKPKASQLEKDDSGMIPPAVVAAEGEEALA
jgi:hypothetical protein